MLTVTALTKSFATPDGPARVVDKVGFTVAEGECYALLGPSGCGKTTTLRCIAGLEPIDRGTIAIGSKVVSDPARGIFVPTHERAIGMVFQSYAIWPHFDVFVNVAYPLQVARPRLGRHEIEARVMEVLALVGMADMARRPATRLSGGSSSASRSHARSCAARRCCCPPESRVAGRRARSCMPTSASTSMTRASISWRPKRGRCTCSG